jgi:hypothetical protein
MNKERKRNKRKATIYIYGKQTHLGFLNGEEDAARAYDDAPISIGKSVNYLRKY